MSTTTAISSPTDALRLPRQDDPLVGGNVVGLIVDQARLHPTRTALVVPLEWDTHRVHAVDAGTYGDIARRAAAWQMRLTDAGIAPGHRVLLLLGASVDLYAAALATIASGAVIVLVDRGMSFARIRAAVDRAESDAVLVGPEMRRFVRVVPELRRIPRVIDAPPGADDLVAAPAVPTIVDRAPEDGAIVSFTSGSTGRPKGADRTHATLRAQHASLARAFPFEPGDVDMTAWPVVVLHDLLSGVPAVVPPVRRGDLAGVPAEATLSLAIDHGVTLLDGPPAFIEPLVVRAARRSARPALRRIITGGGPVLPSLCRSVIDTFPRTEGIVLYGGTEAEPVAHAPMTELVAADDDGSWSAGAGLLVGPTVPDIDVRLLVLGDEAATAAGAPAEPGAWGEIAVRGEHVLSRWFRDPAAERTTMVATPEGTLLRTGDVGRFDHDDRLWLGGRVADVVGSGTATWHPYEIEPVLDALPGVRRTALLADPDGRPEVFVDGPDHEHPDLDVVGEVRRALVRLGHPDVTVHGPVAIPVDGRHNSKVDRPGLRSRRTRILARARLRSLRSLGVRR